VHPRETHRVGDLLPGAREADDCRASPRDTRVACVERELEWLGACAVGSEGSPQIREQRADVVDAERL
jgi:hypothetical protein